jgi:hypothetical protein
MDRIARIHRLYAVAIVAIWIEAVLGLVWLTRRHRDSSPAA